MSYLSDHYPNVNARDLAVLEDLWSFAKELEPKAVEGLSYGLPGLKLNGRPLIGFAITKKHMSIYPYSPKIIDAVRDELDGFDVGRGVVRFSKERVVPKSVIALIIDLRMQELAK